MENFNTESVKFGTCPKCEAQVQFSLTWTLRNLLTGERSFDVYTEAACRSCGQIVNGRLRGKDGTPLFLSVPQLAKMQESLYRQFVEVTLKEKLKISDVPS